MYYFGKLTLQIQNRLDHTWPGLWCELERVMVRFGEIPKEAISSTGDPAQSWHVIFYYLDSRSRLNGRPRSINTTDTVTVSSDRLRDDQLIENIKISGFYWPSDLKKKKI